MGDDINQREDVDENSGDSMNIIADENERKKLRVNRFKKTKNNQSSKIYKEETLIEHEMALQ